MKLKLKNFLLSFWSFNYPGLFLMSKIKEFTNLLAYIFVKPIIDFSIHMRPLVSAWYKAIFLEFFFNTTVPLYARLTYILGNLYIIVMLFKCVWIISDSTELDLASIWVVYYYLYFCPLSPNYGPGYLWWDHRYLLRLVGALLVLNWILARDNYLLEHPELLRGVFDSDILSPTTVVVEPPKTS